MAPTSLIGRDAQRATIARLLDDARRGRAGVLVVRGEAGIGKSALLADAAAATHDMTLTRVVGVEAESQLAFAALATVLAPLAPFIAALAGTRGDALRSALAHGEVPTSPLAVGSATLDVLSAAADAGPVHVQIDDAQWIDDASAGALVFALRRLDMDRVGALVAVRSSETSRFDDAGFDELPLEGIDADAGIALLRTTGPIEYGVAKQCWSDVGGNPLALIELGGLLDDGQRRGIQPVAGDVHLGERLRLAFTRQIEALPPPTRTALGVAAVADRGDLGPIGDALAALGSSLDAFAPAERAGVVVIADGVIEFRHPLLRAGCAGTMDAPARRAAHGALAGALADPADADRRAWHLAGAATGPDEHAASALADAAERALRRGGASSAARTLERAARLSPDPADAVARLLGAALAYWDASAARRAIEVLEEVISRTDDALVHADAASALGEALGWEDNVWIGVRFLVDEAAAVERLDHERAAVMLIRAAMLAQMGGDVARAVELTEHACRAAAVSGGAIEIGARCARVMALHNSGHGRQAGDDIALLDAMAALPLDDADTNVLTVMQLAGYTQMVREEWDLARATFDRVAAAARRLGLPGVLGFSGAMRGEVDFRTGRWAEAQAEALADVTLNASRPEPTGYFGNATLARIEAALGLDAKCREHAATAIATGRRLGMAMLETWAAAALGLLELGRGDAETAVGYLGPVRQTFERGHCDDPGPLWWQGDLIEAYVALGAREQAARLTRQLATQAAETGRMWGEAIAARGEGLLAARDGNDALARSAELLDRLGAPFELARTRLLQGEMRVRRGDRAGSRAPLEAAYDTFERLGAAPWAARARVALGLHETNATRPRLAGILTTAELRVALAVGQGLSNREAAERLYLSTRTVDAHLRSIYRKLGVRSRTELAVLVAKDSAS